MKITGNYYLHSKNQSTKKSPTFQRKWAEHVSWGANYIKQTNKANFKLFTFPDAKMAFVEVAKNAQKNMGNIKNRIVQVLAVQGLGLTISEIKEKDDETKIHPLKNNGGGVFSTENIDVEENAQYRFIVVDKDNKINLVKDPYAKKQSDIHGWSEIYNSDNYEWKSTDWLNGKDPRRIVRKPNEPLRGLENLIIEEINIPTLSEEGTFDKAKAHIDKIAKKGIATAIEIMPVENTFSQQWGYDGVDKFAVNEKLGGAVQLKELIDYAHEKGLNVIIDIVPNHMGPDGDYLSQTGPYEVGAGEFGSKLNYEKNHNRYVRDWMANAALWYANEFKVDGIRFDMTKQADSNFFLKQVVTELNQHNPNVFTIAEDGRDNYHAVTRYETKLKDHEEILDYIDLNIDFINTRNWSTTTSHIGFDSEWDFPFLHAIRSAVIHNREASLNDIDKTIRNSAHRVKYVLSHDEIGNYDGTKLIAKIVAQKLNFFANIDGVSEQDRGQKAAQLSHKLVTEIMKNPQILNSQLAKIQKDYNFTQKFYDKEAITDAINSAINKARLGYGTVMSVPGPKMFFQGDDEMDMSHFKFFRKFSDEDAIRAKNPDFKQKIINEKGYDTYIDDARNDSIIGKIKFSDEYQAKSAKMVQYFKDFKNLMEEYPALKSGEMISTYKDHGPLVHMHTLRDKDGNEVLVIKNFGNDKFEGNYSTLGFPKKGEWTEILNSDDAKYDGGGLTNKDRIISDLNQNFNLAANSIVILKKITV